MNAIVKRQSIVDLDGFNDFTNEVEGQEEDRASSRVIIGAKIKFIFPPGSWLDTAENNITGKRLTVLGTRNVVNKWGHDNMPIETHILAPGEKFPNFDERNAKCPQSEWREKFGRMVGPWEGQHVVYFIDELYNRYSWPSPITTIGSAICVRELAEQIKLVRKVKRVLNLFPVTELDCIDFPTSYGPRQRPHLLNIKDWVSLGEGDNRTSLPAPDSTLTIEAAPAAVTATPGVPAGAQRVGKPTAKEVTDDEIRF
jgi:hypothetical protein